MQQRKPKQQKPPGYQDPRWAQVIKALSYVEAGWWTTYGDLAKLTGLSAPSVGTVMGTEKVDNPHRVLRADGTIAPDFRWPDSNRTDDPQRARQVLESEGLRFDEAGHADPDQRFTVDELREQAQTDELRLSDPCIVFDLGVVAVRAGQSGVTGEEGYIEQFGQGDVGRVVGGKGVPQLPYPADQWAVRDPGHGAVPDLGQCLTGLGGGDLPPQHHPPDDVGRFQVDQLTRDPDPVRTRPRSSGLVSSRTKSSINADASSTNAIIGGRRGHRRTLLRRPPGSRHHCARGAGRLVPAVRPSSVYVPTG
jgi:alkylated DNA nucleotide flippase Atl1